MYSISLNINCLDCGLVNSQIEFDSSTWDVATQTELYCSPKELALFYSRPVL